jgi:hypothetical protein
MTISMKIKPLEIINTKKQENGLWGMPINVKTLKLNKLMSDDDSLKFSAIIVGIVQIHGDNCSLGIQKSF